MVSYTSATTGKTFSGKHFDFLVYVKNEFNVNNSTMKLHLKNFRCYDDKTFDLGDRGLTLLSAATGSGKSSILMAIHFALFGVGTKVVSYGKSSCLVELEVGDLKISRTRRPNRLVVNGTHEDKAGQDIINKIFGETYETTGYISQNGLNSFVLMGPMDKLGFLETFAFKDVNLGEVKSTCKSLITKKHDHLKTVSGKLEAANEMLSMQIEPKATLFPIKCRISDREKIAKGESIKCKNRATSARKAAKDSLIVQEELQILTQFSADNSKNDITLASLRSKHDKTSLSIQNIGNCDEELLVELKDRLSGLIASRKVEDLRKRLNDDQESLKQMEEDEITSMEDDIRTIENNLWTEYTKDDYTEYLEDMQKASEINDLLKDLENVESLVVEQKQIVYDSAVKELEQKIISNSNGKVYKCPCCETDLHLKDGGLHKHNDGIMEEVSDDDLSRANSTTKKLERELATLTRDLEAKEGLTERYLERIGGYEGISSVAEVRDFLGSLRDYKATQDESERQQRRIRKAIDEKNYSKSYKAFNKSCETLSQEMSDEQEISGNINYSDIDEEELRDSIIKLEADSKSLRSWKIEIKTLTKAIIETRNATETAEKEYLKRYSSFRHPDELKTDIKLLKIQQEKFEAEYKIHLTNTEAIKEWEKEEASRTEYNLKKEMVSTREREEKEARLSYASATLLKSKIAEAESMEMIGIIDSINIHSQLYLETFFPENPISVVLTPFKEGKKTTKPQINLKVEHKGMECDISSLSGGELSRVVLAFTLALAEMFNTPLLLLDECTSSLDQEMTGTVLAGIKENFSGKMVLIVAHQVVTGVFDKVMTLE